MNKIYKIVWNAAQEAWVAVSELAKGHVKASSSGKNAKQSTVVEEEEEGSASSTLYSLGKAAANAMVIGGVAVTLLSLSQTAQAAELEAELKEENLIGKDIQISNRPAKNGLVSGAIVGQQINITNSSVRRTPVFGQNINITANSTIHRSLVNGFSTNFNNASVERSVFSLHESNVTGRIQDSTIVGRKIDIKGDRLLFDISSIGNRNTFTGDATLTNVVGSDNNVTTYRTSVLGSKINANVSNSVYLGDASVVEESPDNAGGRSAGVGRYLEEFMQDGVTTSFAGGNNVVGGVSVGNVTHTRRIQHVAPGYYGENSTDAVNGSQLYAVGEFANRSFNLAETAKETADSALTKAGEAAQAAKAADDKAVAAQARADAAHSLATTANTSAAAAKNAADAAQTRADDAYDVAGTAMQEARTANNAAGVAKNRADEAYTLAERANGNANTALIKANAADAKAASAQADAAKAKTDAAAAKNDAGAALTKANQAAQAAQAADAKAVAADTKAGKAAEAAQAADAKAVAADTKADGAVAKAEAADAKAVAADAKAVAADTKADGAVAKAEAADAKAVAADTKAGKAATDAADALAKAGEAKDAAKAADDKAVAADAKAVAADTKADGAVAKAEAADAKAVAADAKAVAADAKAVAADTKAGKAATDAANALTTANGIDGKVSKALQAVDKGWTLQTEPGTETTINAANNVVRFKAGDNIKISQTGGNITVALTNDINVTKVTAGTVVAGNLTAKNATLGGAGHTVKVENGTNVDMGGNQIHNVGDGVKDSDAATVGQLNRALDQVAGSPAKINELNNRVDKMNKEMRGYAANAMAVTALPQVYTAGDSMISAAVGSQGGAASVAVGYSRASDNGKVVIKLNMAASSSGEKGVAAGVGYKW